MDSPAVPSVKAFEPLTIRGETFANRIWVSPMCQYSAVDGVPQPWHLVHLGAMAVGRPGLVMAEATAVSPVGRITPFCAGIWTDEQAEAWTDVVRFAGSQDVPLGLQLAHAGRKGSTDALWNGAGPLSEAGGGWEPVAPSPIAYGGLRMPRALSHREIDEIVEDFGRGAARAVGAGFRAIEIHAGHGYLLHEFLSPLSNRRDDDYGGSLENRSRLLLRVVGAIRAAIPPRFPLFARLSATDWIPGGWDVPQLLQIVPELERAGVDAFDISSGGLDRHQAIAPAPGYQVPFARAVREVVNVPVVAVGLLTGGTQIEQILASSDADAVFVGREFLRDRMLPFTVAAELGQDLPWPRQYRPARRSIPRTGARSPRLPRAAS